MSLVTKQGNVQKRMNLLELQTKKPATASEKCHNSWLLQGTDLPADHGNCKVSGVIASMTEILLAQLPHLSC